MTPPFNSCETSSEALINQKLFPGKLQLNEVLLTLMVIALSVQGPTLFNLGSMGFTLGHALVGLVGCIAAIRCLSVGKRVVLPPTSLHVLFFVFVAITIFDASSVYGFGTMIFKYVFQYLVLVVSLNLFVLIGNKERALRALTLGAWLVLGIVLINAVVHYPVFIEYYSHPWDGHPNYSTVFSGGVNLEATWPAMLGVFFKDNKEGHIYLAITYVFAAIVQSRAGILLAILAIAYVVIIRRHDASRIAARVAVVLVAALCAVLFVLVGPRAIAAHQSEVVTHEAALKATENASVLEGQSISSQPKGTPGRRGIWAGAIKLLPDLPLSGFGAGNAMDAVRAITHYPYQEDNVHNYPLQILLDFGVVGFATYAVLAIAFIVHALKAHLLNPFAAFVLLYLIGGLIQFAGGELLVGFALAGYFAFGPDMQGGYAWILGSGRVRKVLAPELSAAERPANE